MGRGQILLENEISIFKKLVSRRKHEVLQNLLVNGCSDVGFQKTQWTNTSRCHCTPNLHRLWKLNTGLQATWAMSFSTLPPDSRTLVSKLNTKLSLIWKVDFGPLGNSPVLLLLSPGKTPLTTTVAKFLDTSVCGGSWCLDPSLSPFLVKFTKFLNQFCLTILIRLRFSQLVVHLFLPHFFLPLNFLLTCLDTALCEQPASLAMNVCGLPSLWRVSIRGGRYDQNLISRYDKFYITNSQCVTMRMEGSKRKRIVNTVFNEGAKNKAVCRA